MHRAVQGVAKRPRDRRAVALAAEAGVDALAPRQHDSLSGRRTALAFQARIAAT